MMMEDTSISHQKITIEIHRLVYENRPEELNLYLCNMKQTLSSDVAVTEGLNGLFRGQTPISLAVTLQRQKCVKVLLEHGSSCLKRNVVHCTPYQEATSIGDRDMMTMLIHARNKQLTDWFTTKGKPMLATFFQVSYYTAN